MEPDDAGALAGAMLRLATEPELAAELGRKGHQRAAAFRWPLAAERLRAVFDEALAEGEP